MAPDDGHQLDLSQVILEMREETRQFREESQRFWEETQRARQSYEDQLQITREFIRRNELAFVNFSQEIREMQKETRANTLALRELAGTSEPSGRGSSPFSTVFKAVRATAERLGHGDEPCARSVKRPTR